MPTAAATTIENIRQQMGDDLVILGHHYQNDAVVFHTDHVGDSLELASKIPHLSAANIVFCGVHFMAESAAILAQTGQKVFLPETTASCFMADMAPADLAAKVLHRLQSTGRKVIPLTYVNSSADLKALCGRHGGSVCTSANASTMMQWALERGDHVLFLPDRHLAVNTARQIGLSDQDHIMLDIRQGGKNIDPVSVLRGRLLIWPGLCVVHARFKATLVDEIRSNDPKALIVAHPECHPDLVSRVDACGSTSFIINYCKEAPEGSTIFVATEFNLVNRLKQHYAGRKRIEPLYASFCSSMGKTTVDKLAALLTNLGKTCDIRVPEDVREPSALALTRMLEACGK